jgi:transitional endoplasmic reticulum ATPase
MPQLDLEAQTIPPEVLESLSVTRDDFVEALKRVQPSAMREVMVQVPNIGWADIGGLDDAQEAEGRRRAAAQEPRGVPPAGHPAGQGLPALWPARHRQDLLAKAVAKEAKPTSSRSSRPTCCPNGTARASSRSAACSPAPGRSRPA